LQTLRFFQLARPDPKAAGGNDGPFSADRSSIVKSAILHPVHPDIGFRPTGLVGFDIEKPSDDEFCDIVNTFSLDVAIRRKRQTQFHTVFSGILRVAIVAGPGTGRRKTQGMIAVLHRYNIGTTVTHIRYAKLAIRGVMAKYF